MAFKDILMWILIVGLSVCLVVLWLKKPKVITETTVIEKTDTIRVEKPVPTFITIRDYAFFDVPKDSLIYINNTDTVYVKIPIEEKVYQDSTYKLQISGYKPNLDWIEVYQKTTTITNNTITTKKPIITFSAGAFAGWSPIYNKFDVILGAGVSIPIYSIYR